MKRIRLLLALPAICHAAPESFPAANGLQRTLVAREPLIKNPVTVTMDVDGTIYLTETTRRKAADLDIREFTQWIPNDLSHTTIEDKLAFFRKEVTPGKFDKHPSLKDHNRDGKVDIKDLTVLSEKIIRLTDTDGDGVIDASNVFAENFNTEVTGIAAGVFAWRGDVYATIAPDVWRLRDTDGDGKADQRASIAHGFGVHIAYAGHDMHGLTWGPDGRLYWSIGDKGTNVLSKEGKRWAAPHEGAVLRCFPDGSGFEIFARGLRNPQEIAFDAYGNLFSVDNDADMKGERERFVYITEGSDSGWRCHYQYRGSDYQPWMAESISLPNGIYQPAYITPPLASYSDGPSGFAWNPGTALNERYKDHFFVTEFPAGRVRAFQVEANGAAFKMKNDHVVLSGPMNIGCDFGPDGALYFADWSGGYPLNEKGAIWKLDDPKETNNPSRKQTAAMLKAGPAKTPTADLLRHLSHPDQRVRLDVQWELAKRKATKELTALAADTKSPQLAVIHALWGLSQTKTFEPELFKALITHRDPELRAQASKWAGESSEASVSDLTNQLKDPSPRVRYHAAIAIGKLHMTESRDAVIAMLAENANRDAFLRHAGAMALVGMEPEAIKQPLLDHPSTAVRLAAAVVFRRLKHPAAYHLLADADPAVVSEAARAIYDEPRILQVEPALASLLERKPTAQPPAIRRSIAANRRAADALAAGRLATFATSEAAIDLRIAALEALASWPIAVNLDPVDGRWDPIRPADSNIAREAIAPHLAKIGAEKNEAFRKKAAAMEKSLGILRDPAALAKLVTDTKAEPAARVAALTSLNGQSDIAPLALTLLNDASPAVRTAAAKMLANSHPEEVFAYIEKAVADSKDIVERQQAILLLTKLDKPQRSNLIASGLLGAQSPGVMLEWFEVATELKDDPILVPVLSGARAALKEKHPLGEHAISLEGGDPVLGAKIFNEHLAAQCIACHRIGDEGSNVGPPLNGIGSKGREHILESLVNPQAKVAPGYGMVVLSNKDGTSVSGALKERGENHIVLLNPDGTEQRHSLEQMANLTAPLSTMPPMAGILTPRELRDLTAWLAELK
jgi:putative membrane-bound dehydrogenase-like protein